MRLEGKTNEKLERLQRMIEEGKNLVMHDEEKFVKLLDELVIELVNIVKEQ